MDLVHSERERCLQHSTVSS